jgi:hypothetical protein
MSRSASSDGAFNIKDVEQTSVPELRAERGRKDLGLWANGRFFAVVFVVGFSLFEVSSEKKNIKNYVLILTVWF